MNELNLIKAVREISDRFSMQILPIQIRLEENKLNIIKKIVPFNE